MKISLTKFGLPQVVVFPAVILMLMVAAVAPGAAILPIPAVFAIEAGLLVLLVFVLAFFRDPNRDVPEGAGLILSPADGRITDIETVDEPCLGGPAIRIGIFLNIFNVHINRMPCAARVEQISYKKGRYKNAMTAESGRVNESNDVTITRLDEPEDRLLLRQVSGAIARRIVCCAKEGQEFTGGQQFGMIKFGSRTELYIPAGEKLKCLAKIGDKVKAGVTILASYQNG